MLEGDSATAADESGLDSATIERVAEMADVKHQTLATALVILHAELIGRHSNLEHSTDYVTVDGTRAYRVHQS
ncbi:hypothetical protein EGH23_26165, partial [Halomicroarcula sp. F27]|nr:hypothetical protein [Halomicroarcula nitratireducens]